jgi:hypothetical protein
MEKRATTNSNVSAQPRFHQRAGEIQAYGTVNHALPLELEEPVRLQMTEQLNQLLADTITLFVICTKSLTGRLPALPSISCICSSISTIASKANWSTQLPKGFRRLEV